eukprot:TRINITY_DN881_c1_g1_i1.p1 TRINITY_DN881_c1_g1~~TRINITY_DN881_c1_g1_i1.p1  ORF type:complete len:715 (+),score=257.03 TRINITY_DN881_c1_g1_i1:1906-4050(+)
MSKVWHSLLREPTKAVDAYFEGIMDELLQGMYDRLWRVREACSLGLVDLLAGRAMAEVRPYLGELWLRSSRVMDDIKETVRKAGKMVAQKLGDLSVRLCDPGLSSERQAQDAVDIVLPFLIRQGITNASQEVQVFSVSWIVKVTKAAGILVQKHIPEMTVILLESLSNLEPQQFSYMQFHTGSMDMTHEQLESARLAMSQRTPMYETVERIIPYINDEVLTDLVPKLSSIIKQGVGLPTTVASAQYLCSLVNNRPLDMKAFSGKLLKSLSSAMEKHRSPSVRKALASAAAHLCRVAKPKRVNAYTDHLRSMYLKPEETSEPTVEMRLTVVHGFQALNKYSSDVMRNVMVDVVAVIYLGRFDSEKEVNEKFKEVWEEIAPGEESGVRLYRNEMVELALECIQASRWSTKKQGAQMFAKVAGYSKAEFSEHLEKVMPVLMQALRGRLFDGKEKLVEALASIVVACNDVIMQQQSGQDSEYGIDAIVAVLLKETGRKDRVYKRHAINGLAQVLEVVDVDVYDDVHKTLYPIIDRSTAEEETEQESSSGKKKKEESEMQDPFLQEAVFSVLESAYPSAASETRHRRHATELINAYAGWIGESTWTVRISLIQCILAVLSRIGQDKPEVLTSLLFDEETALFHSVQTSIYVCLEDRKYTQLRREAIGLVKWMLLESVEGGCVDRIAEDDRVGMIERLTELEGDKDEKIVDMAVELLALF